MIVGLRFDSVCMDCFDRLAVCACVVSGAGRPGSDCAPSAGLILMILCLEIQWKRDHIVKMIEVCIVMYADMSRSWYSLEC